MSTFPRDEPAWVQVLFLSIDGWEVLGNTHHTSTARVVWGSKEIIPAKYLANMWIHSHSYPSPWLCWHFIFFLGGQRWGIWSSFELKEKNREEHLSTFRVWGVLILKMIRWAKQSILLPQFSPQHWGEKQRHEEVQWSFQNRRQVTACDPAFWHLTQWSPPTLALKLRSTGDDRQGRS